MARNHNDLRRRFCEVEADIVACSGTTLTPEKIGEWKGRRLLIESDEPPTYVALNVLCDIELRRAYGLDLQTSEENRLPIWKRLSAHFFIWENS